MTPFHVVLAHVGLVGFSLVVIAFLIFVPFYRTFTGWLLFTVKVNLWLILLLVVLVHRGADNLLTDILRNIVYPATAVESFALLAVILREQFTNRKVKVLPLQKASR